MRQATARNSKASIMLSGRKPPAKARSPEQTQQEMSRSYLKAEAYGMTMDVANTMLYSIGTASGDKPEKTKEFLDEEKKHFGSFLYRPENSAARH